MGFLDWLFNVEIPEGETDELYPEESEDDPQAPQRVHNEIHGFEELFGAEAQTERMDRDFEEEPDRGRDDPEREEEEDDERGEEDADNDE